MSEIPIQRYEMIAVTRCGEGWQELQREPEGDWVTYADHLKELEELRERNRYLMDENDGLESAVSAHEGEAAYALERSALLAAANVELDTVRAQLRSKDEQLAGMRAPVTVKEWRSALDQQFKEDGSKPRWAHFPTPFSHGIADKIIAARAALSGPSPAQEEKP